MKEDKKFNGFSSQEQYERAMKLVSEIDHDKSDYLAVFLNDIFAEIWIGDYRYEVWQNSRYGYVIDVYSMDANGGEEHLGWYHDCEVDAYSGKFFNVASQVLGIANQDWSFAV